MTGIDRDGLDHLLTWVQDGVVSRRQLLDLGAAPHDVRRMLRRGELFVRHPGVYIVHNGPPTWAQRAWSAVLHHAPAVLDLESAMPHPPADAPIKVAVGLHRTIRPVAGVVVRRVAHLEARTRLHSAPPRMSIEHAALDLALSTTSVSAKFRALTDAVGTRETTPQRLAQALASRGRVRGRALVAAMIDDLSTGACSVLEREYLRLERLHGLPRASRQPRHRVGGRTALRDVHYPRQRTVVELDGRAFHDNARARDDDFERDLDTAVEQGDLTLRLTYGQVFDRGCRTIGKVATLLQRRGWDGALRPCPACPPDQVR